MPAVGTNIQFESEAPNFDRDSFKTLAQMAAYTICDEGHVSWNKETKQRYIFDKTNELDPVTGYWRKYEPGAKVESIPISVIDELFNG